MDYPVQLLVGYAKSMDVKTATSLLAMRTMKVMKIINLSGFFFVYFTGTFQTDSIKLLRKIINI